MRLKVIAIALILLILLFGCVRPTAETGNNAAAGEPQVTEPDNGQLPATEPQAENPEPNGQQILPWQPESQQPEPALESATCTSSPAYEFVSGSVEGTSLVAAFKNSYGVILYRPGCTLEGTTGDRCGTNLASVNPGEEFIITVSDAPQESNISIKMQNTAKVPVVENVTCAK